MTREVVIRHLSSTDGWRDLQALEVVVDGVYVGGGMYETEEPDLPQTATETSMAWVSETFESMALALKLVPKHEYITLPVEAFLDRMDT